MNSGANWLIVVNVAALILSPQIAIWVALLMEERRRMRERRMDAFRTLMRYRRLPWALEHTDALNLVEIEFAGEAAVMSAWKEYRFKRSQPVAATANQAEQQKHVRELQTRLVRLLSEMAKALRFKVEQLDILEGNCVPQRGPGEDASTQPPGSRGEREPWTLQQPFCGGPYPYPPPPIKQSAGPRHSG